MFVSRLAGTKGPVVVVDSAVPLKQMPFKNIDEGCKLTGNKGN